MIDEKEIAEKEAVPVAEIPEQTETASTPETDIKAEHSIGKFAREVKVEMKRTNWPTKNELTKMTFVIIATIAAVAIFLFVADKAAQYLMEALLQTPGSK